MQRISGHFLYQVGASLHPVTVLRDETTKGEARAILYTARQWLQNVFGAHEFFRLRASWSKGDEFLKRIAQTLEELDKAAEAAEAAAQGSPQNTREACGMNL